MTQYAAMIYSRDVDWTLPEYAEETAQYSAFAEAAGAVIRGGAALYPTSTATTVRVEAKGGTPLTTDGPYAETKEVLGGYYLVDVKDLDRALELAELLPGVQHEIDVIEVRPLLDLSAIMGS